MNYVYTLKQDLSTAKTNEHNRLDETSIVGKHRCHMAAKFGAFVDEDHSNFLRYTGKRPGFIANPSSCTTTELLVYTFDFLPHCD